MCLKGQLGNLGEPIVSCTSVRGKRSKRENPRRWEKGDQPPNERQNWKKTGVGGRAKSEGPREGRWVVVAEHSTDGVCRWNLRAEKVGNQDPRDPLKGRRSRAQRSTERNYERDIEPTNRINASSVEC